MLKFLPIKTSTKCGPNRTVEDVPDKGKWEIYQNDNQLIITKRSKSPFLQSNNIVWKLVICTIAYSTLILPYVGCRLSSTHMELQSVWTKKISMMSFPAVSSVILADESRFCLLCLIYRERFGIRGSNILKAILLCYSTGWNWVHITKNFLQQ